MTTTQKYATIPIYSEGDYCVRTIIDTEKKLDAFRLRYNVFCQELNWTKKNIERLEFDSYDDNAVSFGLYDKKDTLSGFIRLIPPQRQFMIEDVFAHLMYGHELIKDNNTAELSRLCTSREVRLQTSRNGQGRASLSSMLFKALYIYCSSTDIRFLYGVANEKTRRLLMSNGFQFRTVGRPAAMPDGVVALAGRLDWREFEQNHISRYPEITGYRKAG